MQSESANYQTNFKVTVSGFIIRTILFYLLRQRLYKSGKMMNSEKELSETMTKHKFCELRYRILFGR